MATVDWPSCTKMSSTVTTTGTHSGISVRSWYDLSVNTSSCTATTYSVTIKMGGAFNTTAYCSISGTTYSLAVTGKTTQSSTFAFHNTNSSNNTSSSNKIQAYSATYTFTRTSSAQTITITAFIQHTSGTVIPKATATGTFTVPALDRIGVTFNANDGTIADSPHQQGSNYYKLSSNIVQYSTSASGTYANYVQYFYYSSSGGSTVCNFMNPGTFNITKKGYHVETATGYALGSATGTKLNLDTATWTQLGGSNGSNHTSQTTTSKTVYVNWLVNTWTVVFDGNGNTGGTMANQVHSYGTTLALTANAFTKTGYDFMYWTRDGVTATYPDQYSMPGTWTTTNGNTYTFIANWSQNRTLTYNNGGHGTTPASETIKYSTATTAAPALSEEGYTFTGWLRSDTDTIIQPGAQIKAASTEPTGDITLTAQWSEDTFQVYCNIDPLNTGTVVGAGNYDVGSNVTLTATPNSGYRFDSWDWHTEDDVGDLISSGSSTDNPWNVPSSIINVLERNYALQVQANFIKVPWYIRVNGQWIDGTPYVKVNGEWKLVSATFIKVNGTWIQV